MTQQHEGWRRGSRPHWKGGWTSIWLEQEGEKERVGKKQRMEGILHMVEDKAQRLGDLGSER